MYQGDKSLVTGQIDLVSEDVSNPNYLTPVWVNSFLKRIANSESMLKFQDKSIANSKANLVALIVELSILKGAALNGMTGNVFVETFETIDDIIISFGEYDQEERKLVLE